MTAAPIQPTEQDLTGARRIAVGAGVGTFAAALAISVPLFLLWAAVDAPGLLLPIGSRLVEVSSLSVLAGAILFILCFFLYRRGFATLRKIDVRFTVASVLALVGSLGFLLLLVAAALVLGNESSLLTCVSGHPSHALNCLRSGQPLGAYTGLLGFWLGWIGGVGIVLGLASAGRRFRRGALTAGAALYALLLLILVGPFLALLYPLPGTGELLVAAPFLALIAPLASYVGARRPPTTAVPPR